MQGEPNYGTINNNETLEGAKRTGLLVYASLHKIYFGKETTLRFEDDVL